MDFFENMPDLDISLLTKGKTDVDTKNTKTTQVTDTTDNADVTNTTDNTNKDKSVRDTSASKGSLSNPLHLMIQMKIMIRNQQTLNLLILK